MKVTHENIEAYLLDFSEGNLSEKEIETLRTFIAHHPEYKADLEELDNLPFLPTPAINHQDYANLKVDQGELPAFAEELCFKKAEGTLTEQEEVRYAELQYYSEAVVAHTQYYEMAKVQPDLAVVMPNKGALKKTIVLFSAKVWAVAASVAVLVAATWFFFQTDENTEHPVTQLAKLPVKRAVQVPQADDPVITIKDVPKPKAVTSDKKQTIRPEPRKIVTPIKEITEIEEQLAQAPNVPISKSEKEVINETIIEETQPEPVWVASTTEEVNAGDLLKNWGRNKAKSIVPETLKEDGKLTFASAIEGLSGNKIQIEQSQSPSGKRSFRVAFGKFGIEKIGS